MKFNAESDVFGNEKDDSFRGSIAAIYQTFDGVDVYNSLEEKAANLLYFITKNHSFSDGNKRIAAAIFLYFLDRNNALFHGDQKLVNDYTLVALTIMIAESRPEEKEMMISVVMNVQSRRRHHARQSRFTHSPTPHKKESHSAMLSLSFCMNPVQLRRARFYHGAKFRCAPFVPMGILLGSAFPKPCFALRRKSDPVRLRTIRTKGEPMSRKKYNTPHPTHIVKTRLTDKQYATFTQTLDHCKLSQSEFIRQAITGRSIKATIRISHVDDELLQNVSRLTAEYGKIGSNLNQIAKRLNEFGEPYSGMVQELKAASADLSGLKYEMQRKIGDAIGDIQTYQLKES